MRNLIVFNQVTLDGYFTDQRGDMSWAHKHDPEWNAFVEENAQRGGELIFGRITYELMASHWPTPQAAKENPVVAKQMNDLPKVVFSRTLDKVTWKNTRLVRRDMPGEIRKMKNESGKDLVIFGSGTIVSQLAQQGLIDEYQLVVNPIALGKGRTMFDGIQERLDLQRSTIRTFGNGNVFLSYRPVEHPRKVQQEFSTVSENA